MIRLNWACFNLIFCYSLNNNEYSFCALNKNVKIGSECDTHAFRHADKILTEITTGILMFQWWLLVFYIYNYLSWLYLETIQAFLTNISLIVLSII